MALALWFGRRIAIIAVQLVVISFIAFAVLYVTPGSPEQILLGTNNPSEQALEAVRERYNLNDPFLSQYGSWVVSALHVDFGSSIQTGQSVTAILGDRLPLTLTLTMYAAFLVVLTAVPLGLLAGVKNGRTADRAISAVTTVGVSAPSFATGVVFLYVFAVLLGWFPTFGTGEGFIDRVWHLTLPAVTMALTVIALVVRQTRAVATAVAESDYVLFARARNVPSRLVWRRYLFRNSAMPLATSFGLVLAFFLTGSVIVERTFALSGVGDLILTSVTSKDVPVVQAVAVLAGLMVLVSNLAADVAYMLIDPRVRRKVLA